MYRLASPIVAALAVFAMSATARAEDPPAPTLPSPTTPTLPSPTPSSSISLPPPSPPPKPDYHAIAVRRSGPIAIDGHLDEDDWQKAPKQHGFTQRFPKDGVPATMDTSFAVLYDDGALYIGVWADDPHPELIRALLTRRDVDVPADLVVLGIDSYHDHRTAYAFQLNAAGVQRDLLIYDDTNQDSTWDAVWTGDAAITARGWTAEFRIPFSQLRFATDDVHDWGFQMVRNIGRTQEQSAWSPWPRSTPQVVSKFGTLGGIGHLEAGRRLELLPYVTGGFDLLPVDAGDPLNHHLTARRGVGLDLKYGLGPAFTLSATINPDFGQVEADPSQINLSANELYFAEKRPFFLEGVDLFQLPLGDGSPETQFYSRRIGGTPPNEPTDYDYINWPASTTIYGAAKLAGKTRSGWSVGVLDAVTGAADASIIDDNGVRTDPEVAPLTNFAAARLKRDLRGGKTSIGVSVTAVDRALDGNALADTLHDQAYTAGAQLQHTFDDDRWQANMHFVGSWVHGSEAAITYTEELARHLFQRPDATDVTFDPTRTSLAGLGADWQIGRLGNVPHWRYAFGGELRTPGLEVNDLGFQTWSDRIVPYVWGQYRDDDPGESVLNWQASSDAFTINNFEPTLTDWGIEGGISVMLASYWSLSGNYGYDHAYWDTTLLRGGDAIRADPNLQGSINVTSDPRQWIWVSLAGHVWRNFTTDSIETDFTVGATIQARSNIDLFLGPSYAVRDDALQYVDQIADANGAQHYLFARIDQVTASMTIRANWTLSPRLSLQAYAQPFIGSGRYSEFKDIDNPHAERYADRFHLVEGNELRETDGTYNIGGTGGYAIANPDFDVRQLRSTVVMRWEYRPGSSVYAIWSHNRSDQIADGRFMLGRDLSGLANTPGENVVMVKVNYWIGL